MVLIVIMDIWFKTISTFIFPKHSHKSPSFGDTRQALVLVMTSLEKEKEKQRQRESMQDLRLLCSSAKAKMHKVCEDKDARGGSSFCTVGFRTTLFFLCLFTPLSRSYESCKALRRHLFQKCTFMCNFQM